MPQLVQFFHAESRGSESEHNQDKYIIEETQELRLQIPIPFFQENVLLQFYGFRVATKFYALHELYPLSPEEVNFFLHWTPPEELLVRYSCFQKPPALRLLRTSYQLALSSHCFQVHASQGIHRLKTTTNTVHSRVMVKLAFQMDSLAKLETSNLKGKSASCFGW